MKDWIIKSFKFLIRTLSWVGISAIGGFLLLFLVYKADIGLISDWSHNILVSIDQGANSLLGGDPDETISSRIGKWQNTNFKSSWDWLYYNTAKTICPVLDILMWEKNHCEKSIDNKTGDKAILK